jgi:hypothetical protein
VTGGGANNANRFTWKNDEDEEQHRKETARERTADKESAKGEEAERVRVTDNDEGLRPPHMVSGYLPHGQTPL